MTTERSVAPMSTDVGSRPLLAEPPETGVARRPFAERLIGWRLTLVAALWCLVLLAGWLPNYLNWPWYSDHDHFASTAQLWEAGKLPFRDVFCFQFPGEIYLFWAIGKVFGWGNTIAFYAVDAAMVLGFGAILAAWSRREFGRILPGLIGFLSFLFYYSNQNFRVAGQRDWHATFFSISALLAPMLWRGRGGRLLSAVAFGVALIFRPQSVCFAPAIALSLDCGARQPGERWTVTALALVEYSVAVAATVTLGFLPLIRAGLIGDFLRTLKQMGSNASGYRPSTHSEPADRLIRMAIIAPGLIYVPILLALLWRRDREFKRVCRVVLTAMTLSCFYTLMSPRDHAYFQIPVIAAVSLGMTCLASLILRARGTSQLSLVAMLLCILAAAPRLPDHNLLKPPNEIFFSFQNPTLYTYPDALLHLRFRTLPVRTPTGFLDHYPWDDIRAVITYLRRDVPMSTPVANFLLDTYSSIPSMSGHLPAIPSDNYGLLVSPEWIEKDIAAIAAADPCLVIWNPRTMVVENPSFSGLEAAIRADFEPSKKFGEIEVWRRKTSPPASPINDATPRDPNQAGNPSNERPPVQPQ
jgi:hypothetical protein